MKHDLPSKRPQKSLNQLKFSFILGMFLLMTLSVQPVFSQSGRWQIQYDSEADAALNLGGKTLRGSFETLSQCETYRLSLPEFQRNHTKSVRSSVTDPGKVIMTFPNAPGANNPIPPSAAGSGSERANRVVSQTPKQVNSSPSQPIQAITPPREPKRIKNTEIVIQSGHLKQINAVAFSSDGRYAYSGSRDNTIKIWEISSGKELKTISGSYEEILALVVTPDGQRIVTADNGFTNNIKLFDLNSGDLIRGFNQTTEQAGCLILTPDGQRLAAGIGSEIKIWDLDGKEIRTLKGHSDMVSALVVSKNGKLLISGSRDKTIKVWDLESGSLIKTLAGHTDGITSLAMTPDSQYLFASSFNEDVKVWDVNAGYPKQTLPESRALIIALSPDGNTLAVGAYQGLQLWDWKNNKVMNTLKSESDGWMRALTYNLDGKYLLGGGDSKTLKMWDANAGQELWSVGGNDRPVTSIEISEDGTRMAVAKEAEIVSIWDLKLGTQIATLRQPMGLQSVGISPDGTKTYAGGWNFQEHGTFVQSWDNLSAKAEANVKIDEGYWAQSISVNPANGDVAWSSGPKIMVSDGRTMQIKKTITNSMLDCEIKTIHLRGEYLLTTNARNQLQIWESSSGNLLQTIENSIGNFMPDGKSALLLCWDQDKNSLKLTFWDLAQNKSQKSASVTYPLMVEIGNGMYRYLYLNNLTISNDGNFAAWSADNEVHLWNLNESKEVCTFRGHTGRVTSIKFFPDSEHLASGSEDGTTRVWSTHARYEQLRFVSFNNGEWIALADDGHFNCSPAASDFLGIRQGDYGLPIMGVESQLKNPQAIQAVLSGSMPTDNDLIDRALSNPTYAPAKSGMKLGINEIGVILLAVAFLLWIATWIMILISKIPAFPKIFWMLITLFIPILGPVAYYFIVRRNNL